MRIVTACLVMLLPVIAFAAPVPPKDKYITCNCHITPGLPWKSNATAHSSSATVHHHHKAVKKPATTPVAVKHHHKNPALRKEASYTTIGDGYPGRENIISSNKLALPAGKSAYAPGELVYISGRVLDKKCVPVSDAIVEIWQANPDGHYVKPSLGERLSPSPTFAGSGRATTDNLGRFNFVTVFPGSVGNHAPYIHVRVVHKDFPVLSTEMFFAQDNRNDSDPVLRSLSPAQRAMVIAKVWQRDVNDPEKGLAASWDISLNGQNPYRHF